MGAMWIPREVTYTIHRVLSSPSCFGGSLEKRVVLDASWGFPAGGGVSTMG